MTKNDAKQRKDKVREVLIGVFVFVAIITIFGSILNKIGFDKVQNFVESAGVFSPVVFILATILMMTFAPLTGGSMFVISGVVFGKEMGFIYSTIATLLGCSLNFYLARKFGHKIIAKIRGKKDSKKLENLKDEMSKSSKIAVLGLMLVASDIGSYAVGLTKIKYKWFFLMLITETILGMILYIYLGSSLMDKIFS